MEVSHWGQAFKPGPASFAIVYFLSWMPPGQLLHMFMPPQSHSEMPLKDVSDICFALRKATNPHAKYSASGVVLSSPKFLTELRD